MRRWPQATCAALICANIFLLHTIYLLFYQLFWTSQHCYSILTKSHTSLRWAIPAHTDPLLPMPLNCIGVYTPVLCPMQSAMLLPGQHKPAACSLPQTGTIVPSFERLLKAKQLSGQAANSADRSAQPLSYCSLQQFVSIMPQHGSPLVPFQ